MRERTKNNKQTKSRTVIDDIEDQFEDHFREIEVDFEVEFDPIDHPVMVIEEMSRGASVEELCLLIGILPSVLAEWYHQYPPFRNAVVEGSMLALAWWKAQGRLNLNSSGFQIALYKLEMANRFGYVNKNKPGMKDLKDPRYLLEAIDDDILDVSTLSSEQLEEELDKLEKADGKNTR